MDKLKRADVGMSKAAESGTSLSDSDTVDVDRERVDEAQKTISINEEEIELDSKLDLARAYIEMQDQEAATKLLVEIEAQGSPQQKAQAQELLSTIGES